jgi:SOS-response transcriptional repressor LexA
VLPEADCGARFGVRGLRTDARAESNLSLVKTPTVPHEYKLAGACSVGRVRGPSLSRWGLLEGDLVYIRPEERVRQVVGALSAFELNGATYLKRLTVARRGIVTMLSANDGYDPFAVRAQDEFKLIGVVVASAREF